MLSEIGKRVGRKENSSTSLFTDVQKQLLEWKGKALLSFIGSFFGFFLSQFSFSVEFSF